MHLNITTQNCTLISKIVQNEIIHVIGKFIRFETFAKIADKPTSASTSEQLSLCFCYVYLSGFKVREGFVGFVLMKSANGEATKSAISNEMETLS